EGDRDRPVPIYLDRGLVSPQFREPFERLREDFVKKLKRAAPLPGTAAAPAPSAPIIVAPAPVAAAAGDIVFGFAHPELAQGASAAADRLRALGLKVAFLDSDAVFSDFTAFAGSRALVLPFDDRPALMP